MPTISDRNERVSRAVADALRQRGITHKEAARRLGLSTQTVDNRVSRGIFSSKIAEKWSDALDIPIEVFTMGRNCLPPNDYQAIIGAITSLNLAVATLQEEVALIKHRIENI